MCLSNGIVHAWWRAQTTCSMRPSASHASTITVAAVTRRARVTLGVGGRGLPAHTVSCKQARAVSCTQARVHVRIPTHTHYIVT